MKTFKEYISENVSDSLETYRVTNDHHDIKTNVKAYSPREARALASQNDKRFLHHSTFAEKSWVHESNKE